MAEEIGCTRNAGPMLRGVLIAERIPTKVAAAHLEVDQSYLSKLFAGVRPVQFEHILEVGILIGVGRAQRETKDR